MKNVKTLLVIPVIFAFAVVLSGCANNPSDQMNLTPEGDNAEPGSSPVEEEPAQPEEESGGTLTIETPDRLDLRLTQTPPAGLERVEIPESAPVMGEVPAEILEDIFNDLRERSGADRGDIKVLRAEAVVWNDGSLGCPKPGEVYIQMLINGYWVVLQVEGVPYDYRVSGSEHFILCQVGGTIIDPTGTGREADPQPTILPVIPVKPGEIQDGKPWMPVD